MTGPSSCFTIPGPGVTAATGRIHRHSEFIRPPARLLMALTLVGAAGFAQPPFNTPRLLWNAAPEPGPWLPGKKDNRCGMTSSVFLLFPTACVAEVGELREHGTHNHTPCHFALGETEARRKGIHPRCKATWDQSLDVACPCPCPCHLPKTPCTL